MLASMREASEASVASYSVAHSAVVATAEARIGSFELADAIDTRARIFEAVGGMFRTSNPEDEQVLRTLGLVSARNFVDAATTLDSTLQLLEHAQGRMEQDAPRLTAVVTEVARHHTGYDKVALRFALQGAAVARGMQIFVDRRFKDPQYLLLEQQAS